MVIWEFDLVVDLLSFFFFFFPLRKGLAVYFSLALKHVPLVGSELGVVLLPSRVAGILRACTTPDF